jgi:hypothetical protein
VLYTAALHVEQTPIRLHHDCPLKVISLFVAFKFYIQRGIRMLIIVDYEVNENILYENI